MESIDLKCTKNIVFSHKCRKGEEYQNIKIGIEKCIRYWSYLYFDISEIGSDKEVVKASLILFKVPIRIDTDENSKFVYSIVPTMEYVGKYSYYYTNTIELEEKMLKDFEVKKNLGYVEIDITEIVKKWNDGCLENRGIFIRGKRKSSYIEFNGNGDNGLDYPFLRVEYKEDKINPNCPDIIKPSIKLPVKIKLKGE
ncbi:DNRLRE domain-containing protein [uncultured Clostridium sp.]|uniref:DNRLRE domain-containing protein n=1 Tax=uncultured Clostridium sp. TaxID=59620 RepID=UPI002603AA34|nr:DNRLRE domain-containing protein [uncultured Clostridium sp.]